MTVANHEYYDADDPQHPMTLPSHTAFVIERTEVVLFSRGRTTADDIYTHRHYVRRAR